MAKPNSEFKEIVFPVAWGQIAGKIYGSSKEKRILMVHGILDNCGTFDRLLTFLPTEYQYVSIDLPGHGFSTAYPQGELLQFFNYVNVIDIVLDYLKWDSCIYIGHSMGAQIGIYFSILYPKKIEKIIALDGLVPLSIENDILVDHIRQLSQSKIYDAHQNRLYTKEEVLYALRCKRQTSLNGAAAEALFPRSVTKVGDLYKYNRDLRLRLFVKPALNLEQHVAFLSELCVPVLLIVVQTSYLNTTRLRMLDNVHLLIRNMDSFKYVFVSGNHDVHNNNPEIVAPHICKYLSNHIESKL